ncbi:MAG: type II secretion system protein GspJ [Desulfuromonadales bacterium]|nr:type II secretion system protein GspJ [Desulfuromonadales bacterium]
MGRQSRDKNVAFWLSSSPLTPPPSRIHDASRGFTLVEILVAISILAVVLTSVYGMFASVSATGQRLQADSADYHRARVVFDRLGRELRGAYFRADRPALAFSGNSRADGSAELLLTTTAASPLSRGAGIARVRYLLAEDPEQDGAGRVLLRSEQPAHAPEAPSDLADMMRLAPGIEALRLRFYAAGQWREEWDGQTTGLPELVEVDLRLRTGRPEPVRFVSAFELPRVTVQ